MTGGTLTATILAVGSRGDVQPYLALGRGMRAAGLDVRLATHQEYRAQAEAHGLEFAPVELNPRRLMEDGMAEAWLNSGRNVVKFVHEASRVMRPPFRQVWADSLAASEGADVILYSPLALPAYHVAEYRGVPAIAALWGPIVRTKSFPSIMAPPLPLRLGPLGNWLSHTLMEQATWRPFAGMVNEWRGELGLSPIGSAGLYHHLRRARHVAILGYSEAVVPTPRDWPTDLVEVTGYWSLPLPEDFVAPASVEAFLADGPAPVYVGFGSMRPEDPAAALDSILDALARAAQRGVLELPWMPVDTQLPDNVMAVQEVPHAWLMPRMAAAVHHGGAGTSGSSLRAGLPTLVCPFFADQFFWGRRVHAIGAGPRPLPFKKLTVERLARRLESAVSDSATGRRAAQVGARLRAEDGVARATESVRRHLARAA